MKARFSFLIALLGGMLSAFPLKAQHRQIDSLKSALVTMRDDTNKVNALRQLFISTIDALSADAAMPYAAQSLRLARQLHFEKGEGRAYRLLGVGYAVLGDPGKGIENYLKCLKVYEKIRYPLGISACYNNIGHIYEDQDEPEQALSYYRKALAICAALKNKPENVWQCTMSIGNIYQTQHRDSLAFSTYSKALSQARQLASKPDISVSLYLLAQLYFEHRNYALADRYLQQALELILQTPDLFPRSEIYVLQSKLALIKNRNGRTALSPAKKGMAIARAAGYKQALAASYFQLAEIYTAQGNFKQAFDFQRLYLNLKDSLLNSKNVRTTALLQYQYNLQKKEDQNRELLKNKRINEAELLLRKATIQRQYWIGVVIVLALLSFVLLSYLYYSGYRAKKRDNELLTIDQQKIMEQKDEILAQNEKISRQNAHLDQLNHTKNKLFSVISHDMRTPVVNVLETLRMLQDGTLTREEFDRLSGELSGQVEHTSELLDNVLYWAKNQMEGFRPERTIFNIRQSIAANIAHFSQQAAVKNITLINQAAQDIQVRADASSVDIILRNLLANAIKFCHAGDEITVTCRLQGAFAEIAVRDTGIGMSSEVQQALFQRFDFYSTYGTANEKGTGLGLNLCRDFALMNGGSIRVSSTLGQGSDFTFTIPLA
jgi:two-component system, sensor histidine kinase and response regulator